MSKKQILDYYVGRDATLTTIEDRQKKLSKDYDSALESIVILSDRVSKVDEGEGKIFWENNLNNLKRLFPIIEILMSDNERLRGSFSNLHDMYLDIREKYLDIEEKYNRLTDKLI